MFWVILRQAILLDGDSARRLGYSARERCPGRLWGATTTFLVQVVLRSHLPGDQARCPALVKEVIFSVSACVLRRGKKNVDCTAAPHPAARTTVSYRIVFLPA